MYIQIDNNDTKRIKLPGMSKMAEFNEKGIARVPAEDGEILIEEIEQVRKANKSESNSEE